MEATKIMGIHQEKVVDRSLVEYLIGTSDVRQQAKQVLKKALGGTETTDFECPLVSKAVLFNATSSMPTGAACDGDGGYHISHQNTTSHEEGVTNMLNQPNALARSGVVGIRAKGKIRRGRVVAKPVSTAWVVVPKIDYPFGHFVMARTVFLVALVAAIAGRCDAADLLKDCQGSCAPGLTCPQRVLDPELGEEVSLFDGASGLWLANADHHLIGPGGGGLLGYTWSVWVKRTGTTSGGNLFNIDVMMMIEKETECTPIATVMTAIPIGAPLANMI
jgi:hypothetical protein